jgi:antitoxin PrlF
MLAFKITDKYQTTLPSQVREFLHVKKGDKVVFNIEEGKVVLYKAEPLNHDYLNALTGTLSEWASEADDEAYRGL